jgi:ubiquinone/menaquinone biosynthesis C-methylase UbiE
MNDKPLLFHEFWDDIGKLKPEKKSELNMGEHPDLVRMKTEYGQRAVSIEKSDRYSLFNPPQLFLIQKRQRAVLKILKQNGFFPLNKRKILEIGCGTGGVLLELLSAGADLKNLSGAELILERIVQAKQRLVGSLLTCSDGQKLPYANQSFDLAMQFTVFSSILDSSVKSRLAQEMIRVLRPGGMILWYDFWTNPGNPQTKGINQMEISQLFPNCSFQFTKITLAPPIARRLVSISWQFCDFLEHLRIFNTHHLVAIKPAISSAAT